MTTKTKSYNPQVIADSSGKWCGNALHFATASEARAYVDDLERRWTSVRATRVYETDRPVDARWEDGRLEIISILKGETA